MEGWIFTFGVDGFGADAAPAYEEGVYLNFEKAFKKLCELNSKVKRPSFFEECYRDDDDIELSQAEKAEDWKLYDTLLNKRFITNIEKICSACCVNKEPPLGLYAIEKIEIFE